MVLMKNLNLFQLNPDGKARVQLDLDGKALIPIQVNYLWQGIGVEIFRSKKLGRNWNNEAE